MTAIDVSILIGASALTGGLIGGLIAGAIEHWHCVCACLDCNQLKADSDYDTFLQGPGLARLAGGGNGQGDRS